MIRWRLPADEAGIIKLVREELLPLSPRSGMSGRRLRQEMATRLRSGATLVMSRAGRSGPDAFLHMQIRGRTLFIDLLAVDSAIQNRRWGTELMARAEAYGISLGCAEARVFVDDTNRRGLQFYAKRGYATVRHFPGPKCYELMKPLTPVWP